MAWICQTKRTSITMSLSPVNLEEMTTDQLRAVLKSDGSFSGVGSVAFCFS